MSLAIRLIAVFIAVGCIIECSGSYAARRRCNPKAQRYDRCKNLCKCSSDGSKWDCFRQRKEFTTMARKEKKLYIKAYRELSNPSSRYYKKFSHLITTHKQNFMTSIHQKENFLPWHRWFLLQIENLLRQIDCRVTIPYWDWSACSGDPWSTDLWNDGLYTGFGGNGSKELGYCVPNGPFSSKLGWKPVSSNKQGCTRRHFRGNPPDIVAVEELLKTPASNFSDFEMDLRVVMHDRVHCCIGGTMCSLDSASAPEFFLHHCFIDKLWNDWQEKSPEHKNAYFYNMTAKLPYTSGVLPKDVVDNNNLPGGVKVQYVDINDTDTRSVRKRLKKLTVKELGEISRTDYDADEGVDDIAMKLFRVRAAERRRARRRRRRFRPRFRRRRRMMRSRRARRRGFTLADLAIIEKLHRRRFRFRVSGMGLKWRHRHRRPWRFRHKRPRKHRPKRPRKHSRRPSRFRHKRPRKHRPKRPRKHSRLPSRYRHKRPTKHRPRKHRSKRPGSGSRNVSSRRRSYKRKDLVMGTITVHEDGTPDVFPPDGPYGG